MLCPAGLCDADIVLTPAARRYLATKIDAYLEEARRVDPVLVVASGCDAAAPMADAAKGIDPVIAPRIDPAAEPAAMFVLSAAQLRGLAEQLPALAQEADVHFVFAECCAPLPEDAAL